MSTTGVDILIVDDHADTRRALLRLMSSQGYHAHAVESGAAALEYLNSNLPRLLILDRMMPGIDGLQVLRHIRADVRLMELPVIDYSAAGEGSQNEEFLRLGIQAHIVKGAGWEQLLGEVRRLLGSPKP